MTGRGGVTVSGPVWDQLALPIPVVLAPRDAARHVAVWAPDGCPDRDCHPCHDVYGPDRGADRQP
jgi:hypothetical protein